MDFSRFFPSILLITSAAAASLHVRQDRHPTSSMKTVLKTNVAGGMSSIISNDRARSQTLFFADSGAHPAATASKKPIIRAGSVFKTNDLSASNDVPVPIIDSGFLVLTQIGVGNPPTSYQVIVDTGSSNTFVGANASYVPTDSSHDTGENVTVSYGSGSFTGEEFLDDVTLGSATITSQSIGVTSPDQSNGFNGADGILGLGPDNLTKGTLLNNGSATIPTVTDNLASQGMAASALVGVSIPLATNGGNSGSLDFGAPDSTKFDGNLTFVPITTTAPSSNFWGIDQSITYGDSKLPILSTTAGIVDTGTTMMYLATDAFNAYMSATGASVDSTTGLLTVNDPSQLQSLFFQMGENILEFTANAQIFPRSLSSGDGVDSNATYLIIQDIGKNSGQGMDFINGFTFLQRFYSVFDTPNRQVGFATTSQTTATSN